MVQLTDVSCTKQCWGQRAQALWQPDPVYIWLWPVQLTQAGGPASSPWSVKWGVQGPKPSAVVWGWMRRSHQALCTPQATRRLLLLLPWSLVTPPQPSPHHSALWSLAQPSCPDCGPQTDRAACLQITDILVTVPSPFLFPARDWVMIKSPRQLSKWLSVECHLSNKVPFSSGGGKASAPTSGFYSDSRLR